MLTLPPYSMGIGDRFAHQGSAQLAAFVKAKSLGVDVTPVWNKSNREHLIVHSQPPSVRAEADAAVQSLGWTDPYFVDADHISLKTVDAYIPTADFFTLDVADFIAKPAADSDIKAFVANYARYANSLRIPGIDSPLDASPARLEAIARKYLLAAQEAGRIYRRIAAARAEQPFVAEVSMDETDQPQSPLDLFFILAALADQRIPLQTIAPKFTGRFNKGVDYIGDPRQFEREFNDHLSVIAHAVQEFSLPPNLKLSIHSGSDKFSLYSILHSALKSRGASLHIKTAGTTWLEELIGLACAGGEGLAIAKDIYRQAHARFDELCAPYTSVIDIDRSKLPTPAQIAGWTSPQYTAALRHDPANPAYNASLRQLLHVGYKVAAQMESRYTDALKRYEPTIAENVTSNLFDRHLKPIFVG